MEDVPPPSAASHEFASADVVGGTLQGRPHIDGQPLLQQGLSPVNNPNFQAQYQQQLYGPAPNAFSGQLDMAHGPGPARQGPYSMTAMANALPQSGYRPSYNPGQQQQRFNTGPSSNIMSHVPQMAQFAGPASMAQMGGQPYYVHQHPQMSPYYNAQQHQAAQQPSLSPRHSISYYSNPVMMNQSQHPLPAGYYYPSSNQFPSPHTTIQGQMASAHYLSPDGTSSDPRGASPSQGNDHVGMSAGSARSDSTTVQSRVNLFWNR